MLLTSAWLSLLPTPTSGSGSSLLSALYGGTGQSSIDPVVVLRNAEATQTKAIASQAKQPQTARDIAQFRAVVAKAKTPADVLADPAARKVLLTASGLGAQADFPALAQEALLSDTSKCGSLASQLSNTNWLKTAQLYDFANKGLSVLQSKSVQDTIASGYAEVQWRQGLDASTPGLSKAIDFRARAASVTKVDDILGDSNLRTVVTTALGIPPQIAFQPLQAQEQAISSKLDVTKLKDPAFVESFATRDLVEASTADASGSGAALGSSAGLLI